MDFILRQSASLKATDRGAPTRSAEAISGTLLPCAAVLMYIWGAKVPPESTTVSTPDLAHADDRGLQHDEGAGRWQSYRRNLAEDYRRVFGEDRAA